MVYSKGMKRMLVWLPWILLVLAGAVMVVLYPHFPPTWPCHWNARGEVDGWASKTPLQAAFPLFIAGGLCLLLEVLTQVTNRMSRSSLPPPWPERVAEVQQNCLHCISSALVAFMGYLGCALPFGQPNGWCLVLLVAACVAYPCWAVLALMKEMRAATVLPKGYSGLLYSNADDPRIWVPKLSGLGLTLNFAHTRAKLLLALILAVPLGLVVMGIFAASGH